MENVEMEPSQCIFILSLWCFKKEQPNITSKSKWLKLNSLFSLKKTVPFLSRCRGNNTFAQHFLFLNSRTATAHLITITHNVIVHSKHQDGNLCCMERKRLQDVKFVLVQQTKVSADLPSLTSGAWKSSVSTPPPCLRHKTLKKLLWQ